MEHRTLEHLERVAGVQADYARTPAMSRDERLKRWAELLEMRPDRRLRTLPGTEYQPWETRDTMQSAASPIAVAFDDPVLRAEGLKNDTYGEAKRFFDISDRQLHEIVCYCQYGGTMTAEAAARGVRRTLIAGTT